MNARAQGLNLEVFSIDKFPKMVNYVVPGGVRIADASRIRLGAYLGNGTTVMHEGFVNFNAAALGPNMVEGRISQGVIIGAGRIWAAAPVLKAPFPAVAKSLLASANSVLWVPMRERAYHWGTDVRSKRASTSQQALRLW